MKDFKNDSSAQLSRFGRDKREGNNSNERGERRPRLQRDAADSAQGESRRSYNPNFTADNKPKGGQGGERRSFGEKRSFGDRPYGDRPKGDRKNFGEKREFSEKRVYSDRSESGERSNYEDRKPYAERRNASDRKPFGERRGEGDRKPYGERKSFGDKPYGERRGDGERKPYGERKQYGDKPYGERRGNGERRSFGDKPYGERRGDGERRSFGDKPYGERKQFGERKSFGDKKFGDRKPFAGRRDSSSEERAERPTNYPKYDPNHQTGEMRLNRYIAQSGLCSRREADDYIAAGLVSVNGVVVTELGTKVMPTDEIKFNDSEVKGEKKVYLMLNKPKGYVTSSDDPHADKTVMDLIRNACTERVYPVGRLDKNSLGVLLFTNDGDMTKQLTHPSHRKKKIYHVELDKPVTRADFDSLASGITLEDGDIYADEISYVSENKKEVGIEIHSGRNRIVRRMFEHLGYSVQKLDRVYFAGLTKKNLKRGQWRFLTNEEVTRLKSGRYE